MYDYSNIFFLRISLESFFTLFFSLFFNIFLIIFLILFLTNGEFFFIIYSIHHSLFPLLNVQWLCYLFSSWAEKYSILFSNRTQSSSFICQYDFSFVQVFSFNINFCFHKILFQSILLLILLLFIHILDTKKKQHHKIKNLAEESQYTKFLFSHFFR